MAFSPPRKSLHQHLEDMRLEKSGLGLDAKCELNEDSDIRDTVEE